MREPEDKFRATVALLIVGLLIVMCGQIVALVKGANPEFIGQTATPSTLAFWANPQTYSSKFTLTENGTFNAISAYINASNGDSMQMAIFRDSDGERVALSNTYDFSVNYAWQWLTLNITEVVLSAGDYWIAITCVSPVGSDFIGQTAIGGSNMFYGNILMPISHSALADTTYNAELSIVAHYEPFFGSESADRTDDWMSLAIVIVLSVVNIALCFAPIPFLNFLLGVLSLSVTGASLASVFPLNGWITGFLLLTALATLIVGVLRFRGD